MEPITLLSLFIFIHLLFMIGFGDRVGTAGRLRTIGATIRLIGTLTIAG